MATPAESAPAEIRGERKLIPIDRRQTMLAMIDVEELIGPDHKARAIWELTGRLKLGEWEEGIRTCQGEAGRAAWDPRLLISVWVYGYSEKITSARELERVMEHEPGLQWLTGLHSINHHTLSDFRVSRRKQLDKLFVDLLTVMQEAKLLNLNLVMHDGSKIRAQAGADSFRREETVRERLEQTRALVETDPREPAGRSRREAAQQRARREMEQRLSQAAEELEKIREGRDENEKRQARVSVSEPEARRMKHGDNAFAPSYNLQVSTDSVHGVIVGVDLNQHSDDSHGLKPAMDEVKKNLGRDPQCVVADGGYTNRQTIEEMEEREAFDQLTFVTLLRRLGVTLRDATPPLWLVLTQTIVAFVMIVLGARFFADFVEDFSHAMHFNTLLVALILAPLATELPEAANSLIWTRDSKDVIALGNVTGAMVFQSTFPVTIGVLLTPWQLGQFGTVAAIFALLSGLLIYVQLRMRARENALPLSSLMLGGSLYVVFIGYVLWSVLA